MTTKYPPILCTPAVALALREGRQTQDRRPIKPQPEQGPDGRWWLKAGGVTHCASSPERFADLAPWQPGDVLWVREAWEHHPCAGGKVSTPGDSHPWGSPIYRAGLGAGMAPVCEGFTPWRPSIHMPKWFARTFLRVESVRVERIQEISEEDARADGCASISDFHALWDALYSARGLGWDQNPWVWAYNLKLTAKPKGWPEV